MRLDQKFEHLEDLLLYNRDTIGIHNGVPFIMLIYHPKEERDCREKIERLEEKIFDKNINLLEIPLNKIIFEDLKEEGVLEDIFEYDKEVPKEVREELSKRSREVFKKHIINEIHENDPQIVFLTRVASIYPFYRVSNLFYSLEGEVEVPCVVFYPGEFIDDKLHFMGEVESNEYYRAMRI